jgi:hypothetical protein
MGAMVHLIAGLALLFGAMFTGAAVYVTVVEHPARVSLGAGAAARQFAHGYPRAAGMQATLAIAASLTGVMTWFHGEGIAWLWGALLIFAAVPFTLIVIAPINTRLRAPGAHLDSEETRSLLERWGQLHAIRSLLGLAASCIFAYGVMHL